LIEDVLWLDDDLESHKRVRIAAELGALAEIQAELVGIDRQLICMTGHHVEFARELRNPERVNDIVGEELEDDILALRDDNVVCRDDASGLAGVVGIVDFPPPLLCVDLDSEVACFRIVSVSINGADRRDEDGQEHDGRDDGPDDFERLVAVKLLGALVVGAAAIAEHRVDDGNLHTDEDEQRQEEHYAVEPLNVFGLRRLRRDSGVRALRANRRQQHACCHG
jgi:hypothetical protein